MPDVQMPDGTVVRFPDTMSREQIRGMIATKFPEVANGQQAQTSQPRTMTTEAFNRLPAETQQRFREMGVQVSDNARTGEHHNARVDYNDRGSAMEKFVQGATAGWSDELMGQAAGLQARLQGQNPRDAQISMETQSRMALDNYSQDHPYLGAAAEIAGAIPTMALAGGGIAGQGANLAARLATGGMVGGLQGAVYGAGADNEDRMRGATQGAAWGAGIGAGFPVVGAGFNAGARAVADRVGPFLRGGLNPEAEAARRVAQSRMLDSTNPGGSVMTQADEAIARQNNLPVMNVDRGGEATRSTFRAAANSNPEARDVARTAVDKRFQQQWRQTQDFFDRLMGGNVSNLERQAQITSQARQANSPAYQRAYNAPNAQSVWNADLQNLLQSDAVQQAISQVGARSSNRTAVSGGIPIRNPFRQGSDGRYRVVQQADGTIVTPNLSFWDQVKRNLDGQINRARRGANPDNELEADLTALKQRLVGILDHLVPEYGAARGGAKAFFDAEDALETGRNAWSRPKAVDESLQAIGQLTPAEKQEFGIGLVSQIMDDIRAPRQGRDIMPLFDSPARMQVLEAALGPAKARQVEGYVRVQNILNRTRTATTGNSTTAQQLKDMGILQAAGQQGGIAGAGALGGFGLGGDWNSAGTGALLALAARHGASRLGRSVDDQVMRKMAELLASGDDAAIQRAIGNAMMSAKHMEALKAIGLGIDQALRSTALVGATGN